MAEVVKTTSDPYVGKISLVRVFSGTLRADTIVHVSGHFLADRGHPDHDVDEKIGALTSPLGKTHRSLERCVAGDICAVAKLTRAETGDTLSDKDDPLIMRPWTMPEPLLPVAVVAHTKADEDKLSQGLARLIAEDPTLRLDMNPETHQLVLWCMGEAHLDVLLDRLVEPVRRRRGQRRREGGAAGDLRRARAPGAAGTSSSPAGTGSSRSARSRSSRCRRAAGSNSSTRWSAARSRASSSPRSRRACAPRWSAACSPATPCRTSG